MQEFRTVRDSMGDMQVPASALYGAATARAVENFPISGHPLPARLIHALGAIKAAAAQTHGELGLLPKPLAEAIATTANEIASGMHDAEFPIDVYQSGSGTSTHMNVNEVIATLCHQAGIEAHPNDHINLGQSSNDVFPTAIHLAVATALHEELIPSMQSLQQALDHKAKEFSNLLKIGRTHSMDATPITLGQEFGAWARQAELAASRGQKALEALMELPLGGTAVGTGINADPRSAPRTIARLAQSSGLPFREATHPFEAQSAKDACLEAHGQLATIAISLHKIACDLRLLASGPRCGFGEIQLPAIQPGSSIMPGKVNPVIPEAVTMVAARVAGNQCSVAWCAAGGSLELNVSMPLLATCLLESTSLLARAARCLEQKCIVGIRANEARCQSLIEGSLAMATALTPFIGYDAATEIAKQAVATGSSVRQVCEARGNELGISAVDLATALDPARMAGQPPFKAEPRKNPSSPDDTPHA